MVFVLDYSIISTVSENSGIIIIYKNLQCNHFLHLHFHFFGAGESVSSKQNNISFKIIRVNSNDIYELFGIIGPVFKSQFFSVIKHDQNSVH